MGANNTTPFIRDGVGLFFQEAGINPQPQKITGEVNLNEILEADVSDIRRAAAGRDALGELLRGPGVVMNKKGEILEEIQPGGGKVNLPDTVGVGLPMPHENNGKQCDGLFFELRNEPRIYRCKICGMRARLKQ